MTLEPNNSAQVQLLLIHPIGVGLSSRFWDRFVGCWQKTDCSAELIAPDLLGCGSAPCPAMPLTPDDWAEPLITLIRERARGPAVLVSQGASLPIALSIASKAPELVSALVAISPPGWSLLTQEFAASKADFLWRCLFEGPIGNLFYRYARRERFLDSFSKKNLFAKAEAVDKEWLEMLKKGSRSLETRWAVYSFLAGFWRRDWEPQLTGLEIPIQILFGEDATGIGSSRTWDDLDERLSTYRGKLPQACISTIPGRNVLPYESTEACANSISLWLQTVQP